MKIMYTFYLLLLAGPLHSHVAKMESTINSPITKDYSEMLPEELKKTLMEVITQNNEDKVSKILAQPLAKSFSEYDLRDALELAAKNNYVKIAHKLIEAGADIKERYCYALEDAAEKGHKDMVKALLPVLGSDKRDYSKCYFMDINYFNEKRDVALIRASKNGHSDVMKELIDAGANVNYQDNFGRIALVEAAKNGHAGAVKELIKAKVKVNAFNKNGETALNIAMYLRNVEVIRELLMSPGIDVSSKVSDIQRSYEAYLKRPAILKNLLENDENDKKDIQIFELFKPFMKL
ncbi:MAG: ankyrin repeat domain-containing protein [Candidatus Babeliales bacterium]|nr:ankyrin repeat domain-containing protein [Candidatus Babeliales bacterium]